MFRSVDRWGNIAAGAISGDYIARIVKRGVAALGLNPADYGAHSLRAGFITTAAENGVREVDIMRHSRHKSIKIMRQYIRRASVWEANAAAEVGI